MERDGLGRCMLYRPVARIFVAGANHEKEDLSHVMGSVRAMMVKQKLVKALYQPSIITKKSVINCDYMIWQYIYCLHTFEDVDIF